jgi:hypothetical protein
MKIVGETPSAQAMKKPEAAKIREYSRKKG